MFTKLTPQRIRHNSGYIVQSGGRFSFQYIDGDLVAEIPVDRAKITGLYPDSMTIHKGSNSEAPTEQVRELILNRIIEGLKFWNMEYEICKGSPP